MPDLERLVQIGVVAKAHGLRGEVAIRADEDLVEELLDRPSVLLRRPGGEARRVRVESSRPTPRGALVFFEGVVDRDGAEGLRGAEVLLPRSELSVAEEGEFLTGDLIGLRAVLPGGEPLGRVEGILETGDVPNLIVRGGRELQVPLAELFVKSVDLQAGEIVLEPPEEE